jgi:glycosyltransferase 2 family protein
MTPKLKSQLGLILKLAFAALLIGFMIKSGALNLTQLMSLLTFKNVAIGLVLIGLNISFCAWRWIILLRARGFDVSFIYGFQLFLIGQFFNFALPGSVGGDVLKGYYLVKDNPGRKMDSVLSILIDRILGLYSFFLLSLIAIIWDFDFVMSHEKIRWVAGFCLVIFLVMTVFFLISFSERLYRWSGLHFLGRRFDKLHTLLDAFRQFGKNRGVIATSVTVSIFSQLFVMFFFYYLATAMGETAITWKAILFAVPMGFVVTAVPISPAGVGVGQVAFHYLFEVYLNKTTNFGTIAITACQLASLAWAMVGAVVYIRRRKPEDLKQAEAL